MGEGGFEVFHLRRKVIGFGYLGWLLVGWVWPCGDVAVGFDWLGFVDGVVCDCDSSVKLVGLDWGI